MSAAKSPLLLLWTPHPIVSTIASEFLQEFHLSMVPLKCASWPLVNKPNGLPHERMEVLCGNLIADLGLLKTEVMKITGNLIINEGFPPPCYHLNEMNHLPAW